MNSIFGSVGQLRQNAAFQSNMAGILSNTVPSLNTARVADTLNRADMSKLSLGEKQTLLSVAGQLADDGVISNQDRKALTDLINQYAESGGDASCGTSLCESWPFPEINLGKLAGNFLFNGLVGVLGQALGQSMRDMVFLGTVEGMLKGADCSPWNSALQSAFESVDMSKLNACERGELVSMIAVATCDGNITWPEAQSIMNTLDKALGNCGCEPVPTPEPPCTDSDWTVTETGNGKATIDLGEYTLDLNESRSKLVLTNKETGDKSIIWGDPHFDMNGDGKTDVDFWGTLTLNLENGTKITINTTPWKGNENMTVSSKLTITQGDKAIVVDGLDQNKIGDMTITQSDNGQMLDIFTGDGLDVYENTEGNTWMIQDGFCMREVNQADMTAAKEMESDFSLVENLQRFSVVVGSMVLEELLGSLFTPPVIPLGNNN